MKQKLGFRSINVWTFIFLTIHLTGKGVCDLTEVAVGSGSDVQGLHHPTSFARKLFKLHVTISPENRTPAVEQRLQQQIDSQVGVVERSVKKLNSLVDEKMKITQKRVNRRKNLIKHIRRKRALRRHKRAKLRSAFRFSTPKFDPILSSKDPMELYRKRMYAGRQKGRKSAVHPINLSDFISKHAPILKQIENSPEDVNIFTGSSPRMYSLFGTNYKGRPSGKSRINRPFLRAQRAQKHHYNASDKLYDLLDQKSTLHSLPSFRPEGDLIAHINRQYDRQKIAARQAPIHDLREEYKKSEDALEQFFGPSKQQSNSRFSHKLKALKLRRKRLRQQKAKLAKAHVKIQRNKSKSLISSGKQNSLTQLFKRQNRKEEPKTVLVLPNPDGGQLDQNQKLEILSPVPSIGAINNIFRRIFSRQKSPTPVNRQAVSLPEALKRTDQLPALGLLSYKRPVKPGFKFGHNPHHNRNAVFIPTLSKMIADKKMAETEHNSRAKSKLRFWDNLHPQHSLKEELDSFLNEINNSNAKVGFGII